MVVKTIPVAINVNWFNRICNVRDHWPIEDTIEYLNRMQGGGRTQILIMLGRECLRQMEESK